MPENTVTAPLAPVKPEDVATAFARVAAMQTHDIDTVGPVAGDPDPEMGRLLPDIAARIFPPPPLPLQQTMHHQPPGSAAPRPALTPRSAGRRVSAGC
ncbi:hypothetical protein [Streptomyces griseoluteus]